MNTHNGLTLRHQPILWDLAIAGLALIGISGMITGIAWAHQTHHGAWWILTILSAISLLLLLYGSFIEPRRITVSTKIIHIHPLPSLKIGIISDLHVGPYKGAAFVARIVARMQALHADLIVLPGDFLFDSASCVADLAPLRELHASLGVYATMGNHDAGQHCAYGEYFQTENRTADVQRILAHCGITVLRNQSICLTHEDISFSLVGIDDLWTSSVDLPGALLQTPSSLPIILLSHNPDILLDPAAARASLIIAGHTHGGQVRLPGIGALAPIPSKTGKRYDQGIFTLDSGATLALSHGIGETMCRARLFCPPEILLLSVNPST